ncbi:OadG family protein [Palaeococcus ferrophilus]|uniref:OadG family protein n=1 Tax=Palaeococcus ferrophilus TaxID=83868 RepID=UPI00064F1E6E|nr:OadG family protein [Palaeococcus ferrophilus]
MVSMGAFIEGLYITILGVTVVFGVLIILSLAMYGIGWLERRLVEKETQAVEAPSVAKAVEKPAEEAPKAKIEPKKLAIITAALLAYTAEKNAQLRPLPFKKLPSREWGLYSLQSQMEEVENFNYELGKW